MSSYESVSYQQLYWRTSPGPTESGPYLVLHDFFIDIDRIHAVFEENGEQTGIESTEHTDRIKRRGLLRTVGAAVVAGAGVTAGSSPAAGEPSADIDTTLTLNNVGASAWEVTSISGGQARAPTGEDNPTIELETNARFQIENNGWSVHPLAFRSASNEVLLSQDGSGTFESDPAVNWQDNGSTVAFTLTSDLADALAEYYCTVHSSMAGGLTTGIHDVDVSFSDEQGGVGTEVGVSFDIDPSDDPDAEVGAYDIEIQYDETILSFVTIDGVDLATPTTSEPAPGTVTANVAQASSNPVPLTAGTVVFEVAQGAEDGDVATVALVDAESSFTDPTDPVTFESQSGSVTAVASNADFQVSNLDPQSVTVFEGSSPIDISADVTNVGGDSGQKTLTLELTENDTGQTVFSESQSVQLAAGATQSVTFEGVPAGTLSTGEYTHAVSSPDDSVTGSLTVEPEPDVLDFQVGDVNADGEISIIDTVLIQQHIAGMNPGQFNEALADVDRSGSVSIVDSVLISRFIAGLIRGPEVAINNITTNNSTVTAQLENTGDLGTVDEVQLWTAVDGSQEAAVLNGYRASDAPNPGQLANEVRQSTYDLGPSDQAPVEFDISTLSPGSYRGLVYVPATNTVETFSFQKS